VFRALTIGGSGYQWSKDSLALSNGPTGTGSVIAGSQTDTLTITNVYPADAGGYSVDVVNTCGAVTGGPVSLSVCGSDFTCDGFISGDDFDGYVAAFEAGEPSADFNGDGFVSGDDFDRFVADFEAGCEE
jgi:hypothetical protein